MPVPGNWELNGFGRPVYTNVRCPIPYDPPFVPTENPVGVYRRKFEFDRSKGRCHLNFEGVDSCFYVYINHLGIGSASCGPALAEKYRILDRELGFDFWPKPKKGEK